MRRRFLAGGSSSTRRTTRLARTTRRLATRRAVGSGATSRPVKGRARNEASPRLPLLVDSGADGFPQGHQRLREIGNLALEAGWIVVRKVGDGFARLHDVGEAFTLPLDCRLYPRVRVCVGRARDELDGRIDCRID